MQIANVILLFLDSLVLTFRTGLSTRTMRMETTWLVRPYKTSIEI